MSQSLGGRPSKGRRPSARVSASVSSTSILDRLAAHHGRAALADVVAALMSVGLRHPDQLADGYLLWPTDTLMVPQFLREVDVEPRTEPLVGYYLRIPQLLHDAIEEVVSTYYSGADTGVKIRSALLWVGLHHLDELPAALAELDDFHRRLPDGGTRGDFYLSAVEDFASPDPLSAVAIFAGIHQLRTGSTVDDVAAATSLPRELLADLSVEALSDVEGSLPLTG